MTIEKELRDLNSRDELNQENAIEMVEKSVPSTSKMIVEVTIEKELQDLNSRDELNQENAIEMMGKSIPSTSKVTTEIELQNLNSNPNLNQIEVITEIELQNLNSNPNLNQIEVITAIELQNLNSNPDLNEDNVVEMMSKFIPSHNAIDSITFASDYTLLHIAAALNCDKIADFLIKAGAGVDLQDSDGCTPLHYAAIYGSNIAVAKVLIANGANVNKKDRFERQPLYYALQDNHLRPTNFPIAKFLLKNNADRSDLHTYITKTSKWKCITIAYVTSTTAAAITPFILAHHTNFSVFAIIEGAIASMVSVGVIAYELAYTWAKHAINSKLDKVKLDKVKLDDAPSCSSQPA